MKYDKMYEPFVIRFITQSFTDVVTDVKSIEYMDVILKDIYGIDRMCSSIINPSLAKYARSFLKGQLLEDLYNMCQDTELINVVMKDMIAIKKDIAQTNKNIKKSYNKGNNRKAKKLTSSLKHKEKVYNKVIKTLKYRFGGQSTMKQIYENIEAYTTYGKTSLMDEEYESYDDFDSLESYASNLNSFYEDDEDENDGYISLETLGVNIPNSSRRYSNNSEYSKRANWGWNNPNGIPEIKISVDDKRTEQRLSNLERILESIMRAKYNNMAPVICPDRNNFEDEDEDDDDGSSLDDISMNTTLEDIIEKCGVNSGEPCIEEPDDEDDGIMGIEEMMSVNPDAFFALPREVFVRQLQINKDKISEERVIELIAMYDKANKVADNSTIISAYNNKKNPENQDDQDVVVESKVIVNEKE